MPNDDGTGTNTIESEHLDSVTAELEQTNTGQRNPTKLKRKMGNSYVVSGTVYGLVNVRTDGSKILCATMNEAEHKWQVSVVQSRF